VNEALPEPNMKIVKNYVRKQENKQKVDQTQKCPLCKQNVSINEWSEHLRIELLDPKWREIKQEMMDRKMEISLAPSEDVMTYLNNFSKYRPDLFGDVQDEVCLKLLFYFLLIYKVKMEEKKKSENQKQNIKYEGYGLNITRTTANFAMMGRQMKKDKFDPEKIGAVPVYNTNIIHNLIEQNK